MYSVIKILYSYWSYLVLLVLIYAISNALIRKINGNDFNSKDLRLSLFGLIFSHFQLLIGLILYFVSPWFSKWSKLGIGTVMKNSQMRLNLVEYPFTNIIAIILITMGWSLHKKQSEPGKKFLRIILFYSLGLLLLLCIIPKQS
ncbi:MAG: hypothetical protein CBC81_001000 [Flavobacteriaceae bacterium TMED121]|nr:MAG: hypothetical protein CBC81_001000 [Flavobacteriaceae bacterium TMED121]